VLFWYSIHGNPTSKKGSFASQTRFRLLADSCSAIDGRGRNLCNLVLCSVYRIESTEITAAVGTAEVCFETFAPLKPYQIGAAVVEVLEIAKPYVAFWSWMTNALVTEPGSVVEPTILVVLQAVEAIGALPRER
jgi:hypothetical protein